MKEGFHQSYHSRRPSFWRDRCRLIDYLARDTYFAGLGCGPNIEGLLANVGTMKDDQGFLRLAVDLDATNVITMEIE